MNTKYAFLFLVALYLVMALVNLGGYDLWPPDEPRFAQVAREMMQSGDYLAPHINGHPYHEKPPLLFWATALFSQPFGNVNEWSARLPSVLGGLITLIFTFLLARRLYGQQTAFWAVLILITTQRFWWQSRFGQIDMLLTGCLTFAFYCFWCWHQDRKKTYLVGFYLAIAAGALAKGPPAFVFPLLMVIMFYWNNRLARKQLHLIPGLIGAVLLVCLWLVPARMSISGGEASGASEEITTNLFRQTIGRFVMGVNHINWPWYYMIQTPLDLLPWALFLPLALPWVWKHRKDSEAMRFLVSWTFPAFLFFSISLGKRAIYLLPLFPAFAILIAVALEKAASGEYEKWRKRVGYAWCGFLILLSLAPLLIPFTQNADIWSPTLLIVSAVSLCGAILVFINVRKKDGAQVKQHIAGGFFALSVLVSLLVFPLVDEHKSAKDFCAPLRQLSEANTEYELYSVGFSREEYVFYAKHFHKVIPSDIPLGEGGESMASLENLKAQAEMLRKIQKTVEKLEIADIENIQPEELATLQKAVHAEIEADSAEDENFKIRSHEIVVMLEGLFAVMEDSDPVFIMVQERDWRWVLALNQAALHFPIIENRNVGSRTVLLIANKQAQRLL